MSRYLEGKTIAVTGAGRGIGRAVALACAEAGANVVVNDYGVSIDGKEPTSAVAEEVVAEIKKLGAKAVANANSVAEMAGGASIVKSAIDAFGRIDVVVNNAATALALPLGSFTPEAWAKANDVNLRGPVFLVQAALPHLKASRGNILNVLSGAAFMFSGNVSLYAGAKSALLAYTRSMAAEFAPFGVRANALAPGTTDTDMVRANPQAAIDVMTSINLQKRMAHPDEMVGPALLLTSDAGSFITGQALCVDGGMVPH